MNKDCQTCSSPFYKAPNMSKSYWATRKFCNRKCANEAKKGTFFGSGEKISTALKKAYRENRRTSYFRDHESWNKGTKGIMKAWNKGVKTGIVSSSAFKKGHKSKNPFPKGNIPWNKGIVWDAMRGERHPNWKGGMPRKDRRLTLSYEEHRKYMDWRKAVFSRDTWDCQECGHHGGVLHADHINSWVDYPELRFELTNGRTLCPPCHRKTPSYGRHRQNPLLAGAN